MQFDLKALLTQLGLPVGLIAVFAAILALFGVELDTVLAIAGQMVGVWLIVSLVVDVLKHVGAVQDDTAGKWQAALNIIVLAFIAGTLATDPEFDFANVDTQFITIAKFIALAFGYMTQVTGAKGVHGALVKGLGFTKLSSTAG